MLRITQVEEIERVLLKLPGIVRQQEQRSNGFPDSVAAWLTQLESVFLENKLHHAASIAMLRSELLAVKLGRIPSELTFRGVPSRLRVKSVMAALALQRGADLASTVVQENRKRFSEAEAVAQQLVAIGIARGIVKDRALVMSNTEYLLDLRNRLIQSELTNAVLHLEGLVGPNDLLILLDRALALKRVGLADVPMNDAGRSTTEPTSSASMELPGVPGVPTTTG